MPPLVSQLIPESDAFRRNGDAVKRGRSLLVLEAMKMEHSILAPVDGFVEAIAEATGAQVATRDTLVVITGEIAA